MEHPSQNMKCEAAVNDLSAAVDIAHEQQQLLLDKAVRLAEKMSALYGERQLGRAAQECMDMYKMFMDIIKTFVYPFEVATDCQTLIEKTQQNTPKMKVFAQRISTSFLKFNTHPRSLYMHLLAFHIEPLQLKTLRRFNRPLASFSLQQCESENKVEKSYSKSMFSFTNRPVGNSKYSKGPQWRNKAGYRMQKKRIAQLFYPYFLGRQRDPYKCSACKQYGHNKDSSICPVKLQS